MCSLRLYLILEYRKENTMVFLEEEMRETTFVLLISTHRPMTANREIVERFYADTKAVVTNLVKEYPYIANIKEINDLISE